MRTIALFVLVAATACAPPPEAAFVDPPLYCYRSLADADCYALPYPRDRRRLIGHSGPSPDAVRGTESPTSTAGAGRG